MFEVSSTPLHEQVRMLLLHEIEAGAFADTGRLPTEPELCERFGVSRITVRRAVESLEQAGLVRRQQGRGTFVLPRRAALGAMSLDGFSDFVVGDGERTRTIVRREVVAADEKHAAQLEVPVGDPVLHLVRVLALDGTPLILDSSRYPLSRYPGFDELVADDVSTYEVLRTRYGVVFAEIYREIGIGFTNAQTARWLARPEHDPMVVIRKRAIGEHGEVIHTTRGTVVPSRLKLSLVVTAERR